MNLSPNLGKGNTAAAVYPAIDAQGNVYVAFSEGVVAAYDNQGNELWRYPASGTMGKIDQEDRLSVLTEPSMWVQRIRMPKLLP